MPNRCSKWWPVVPTPAIHRCPLAADRPTIGSLAKQQGYRTACIGKWHLGWDWPIAKGGLKVLRGLDPAKNAPVPDPATQITP